MPKVVELTTRLDCNPDEIWARVQTSQVLQHITAPILRFVPIDKDGFPEVWRVGEYRAQMYLFGLVPMGWQAIAISFPDSEGSTRFLRDNGYSPMIKRWDHWIMIAPTADGAATQYTDRVTVDAGILTPLIAMFARAFYAHRQRRWRGLVKSSFAALNG